MQVITFPGLNLTFAINKIAIQIGSIKIAWYAIFIVIAFIIAMIAYKKMDGKFGIKFDDILELAIYLIPIAFLTARLYYVFFNLEYYINNPIEIMNIHSGGLAIYGGILGGILTIYFYCKKKKIDILDLLDYIVPWLSLGQAIGRWGNFVNIEAYGEQTTLPWRMGIFENGVYKEVHPTFLYESIVTFFLFIFLYRIQKNRKFRGEITYIYLIVYSFARMFIEGIRSDSLMLYDLRISQVVSLVVFVVFCIILVYKIIKDRKTNSTVKK